VPRQLGVAERRCVAAMAAMCAQGLERARLHDEVAASLEAQSRLRKDVEMEVRNHQNAVEGYLAILELAHGDAVTDAQIAYLRNIRRSGAELLESVNSLLYGDIPDLPALRLEDVEVHELVAAAQRYLLPDLRAKRLGFEYRPSSLVLTVRADRAQVTQILLRLLANAIRYTQRGTIVVSFTEHDDSVLVQVSDNGAGIPSGKLRSVFTWSQNAPRPHGERRLPGLNLARARTIAQKLGGDLTASSEHGRGTTFTLTLPRGAPGVQLREE
jgi:signal transduction histidine kinase